MHLSSVEHNNNKKKDSNKPTYWIGHNSWTEYKCYQLHPFLIKYGSMCQYSLSYSSGRNITQDNQCLFPANKHIIIYNF